jgi:hypothetical protein
MPHGANDAKNMSTRVHDKQMHQPSLTGEGCELGDLETRTQALLTQFGQDIELENYVLPHVGPVDLTPRE